jgi:energy-coupling factor transporter ATP-binding protein EcfA2
MKPEYVSLERGKALLIVGPQGCGKSTLAREIAKLSGHYAEICNSAFGNPHDIGSVLDNEPTVPIVVDGLPTRSRGMDEVKKIILFSEVLRERKHFPAKAVRSPHLIFILQSEKDVPEDVKRRFRVLRMKDKENWSLS